jgi:C-terminal processing protease CtpA/Prc
MKKIILLFILSSFSFYAYAQNLNQISRLDKLYGLTNYWQEVNYNFVYFNKVDKAEWNECYKRLLGTVDRLNDFEYYLELQKLSALLNDGHTQVYLPEYLQSQLIQSEFGDFKFYTDLIEGKVVVVRVSTTSKDILPIGTEILKVNGQEIQQYLIEKVKPYLSVSSPHVKDKRAAQLVFRNTKGSVYHIEFKTPRGKTETLDLVLAPTVNKELYPKFPEVATFSSKWLKNGIYYVKMLSFEKSSIYDDFLKVLPELKEAKGIIIDIRYNGGGSSAVSRKVAQHFIKDSLIFGAKNQSRLIIPTDRALGTFLTAQDTFEGKKDWGLNKDETLTYYKSAQGYLYHTYPSLPIKIAKDVQKIIIPTTILTGSNTASAAEDFLIYTNDQTHIKRIGEFTNGSTGQPLTLNLPNGGEAWICTKKVTFSDGTEFVGKGIKPDVKAEYTFRDLLKNEDSVLIKAIEELKSRLGLM